MTKAKIQMGPPGRGRVELDGVDVSNSVRAFTLRAEVGEFPVLELEMTPQWVAVDGAEVEVRIAPGTAHILQLAGWTPPDTKPDPQRCEICGVGPFALASNLAGHRAEKHSEHRDPDHGVHPGADIGPNDLAYPVPRNPDHSAEDRQ